MLDEMYVVGSSWLKLSDDLDLQLDEAVFEAASSALKSAGLKRHQVGLSVTTSLDLYDARSISNALTAPAAAGYLNDELRVEGDAAAATLIAAASLAANQTDVVIVLAVNAPEAGSTSERAVRGLVEHVSSYTFDSHMDRPIGLTANTTLGLHAGRALDTGAVTWEDMVAATADEITRGSASPRAQRAAASAADVAGAPVLVSPLTELMLPAASAGVGALVLASGVVGRRSPHIMARLRGWGSAISPNPSRTAWLNDPTTAAARAAKDAFRRAGVDAADVGYLEMTDLSPSVSADLANSLQLSGVKDRNRSGGVRSNHPGLANGLLRIIEGSEVLTERERGELAVVHAADHLMGLTSSTSSVLVLEAV